MKKALNKIMNEPTKSGEKILLCVINNAISAALLKSYLDKVEADCSQVTLITLRKLKLNWSAKCGHSLEYPAKASLNIWGQYKFVLWYFKAARIVRSFFKNNPMSTKEVYIVNNDNLLTNHCFQNIDQNIKLNVLVEGMMNFQEIETKNRASWRFFVKSIFSKFLRLDWVKPEGHLSGAFDERVAKVISFHEAGLKAPANKVEIVPLVGSCGIKNDDAVLGENDILIVETALYQWMNVEHFNELVSRFESFLKHFKNYSIYVKPHPNYAPSEVFRSALGKYSILDYEGSVEQMAEQLGCKVVLGTCTTALFTLKIMRPNIRCIDFGSDIYVPHAYYGDRSVVDVFNSVGVEIEN